MNQNTCPKCNTPLQPGASFCPSCGNPVTQTGQPQAVRPAYYTPQSPVQKKSQAWIWILVVAVLCFGLALVAVLAAIFIPRFRETSSGTNGAETAEAVELKATQTSDSETVKDTPVPDATAVTAATPEAPQGYFMAYNNVEFIVPADIASSATGITYAAVDSEMYWEIMPKYDSFSLEGYPLQSTFHKPAINIYPVQEYINMNPDIADTVSRLQNLLDNPDGDPDSIPFLPVWNAGPLFTAQVEYLEFNNIKGVRYLTQYGQAAWPVNSHDMFYTFQGLTNDGEYYISVIMPVSHPQLPASGESYTGSMDDLYEDFTAYLDEIVPQLESWQDVEFTPRLTSLDEMVRSIKVK